MEVFFWVTDLLIPVMMIVVGYFFKKHPPTTINSVYGYRTKRSMASKEVWVFAQRYFGGLWLKVGLGLLFIIILDKLLIPIAAENLSLINAVINLIGLIVPIYFVERKLKDDIN